MSIRKSGNPESGLASPGGCASEPQPAEPQPAKPRRETEITLFFGDRQAMHVIPEGRKVDPGDEPLGKVLVGDLIKGPDDPFLIPNMPRGTRLLSFEVRDGIARVDFSREFRDNHPGGSAGEAMTQRQAWLQGLVDAGRDP